MDNRIVSVTGVERVTLAEVKNYIRITNDLDDVLLESMIDQAHQMAEVYLSKDIIAKQRIAYIPYVDREVYLPFTPLDTTVPLVITVDGTQLTTDEYSTFGYENPSLRFSEPLRDVEIAYTTKGLGEEVKQGLLACVAFLYRAGGRGDEALVMNVTTDWKVFLSPYRRLYI